MLNRRKFLKQITFLSAVVHFPFGLTGPHHEVQSDSPKKLTSSDALIILFDPSDIEIVRLRWKYQDIGWVDRGTHAAFYNIKRISFAPTTHQVVSRWTVLIDNKAVSDQFRNSLNILAGDTLQFGPGAIEIAVQHA